MEAETNNKLVHLDLKGAPPKVSYFKEIFPLLSTWGATGLVVEYEDMFPYHGDLSEIACPQAYTPLEVEQILKLARDNNLEVMPLVQTFGHLEFLLKHETFAKLREIPHYPTAVCPNHPDTLATVTAMLDQVLEVHPHIRWLHIGCDEVYHLARCDQCVRQMAEENIPSQQLFFNHVKAVAVHIKTQYPTITPIVWDDMFRFVEVKELLDSGLKDMVEPMVWHYLPSFLLPEKLFDNLAMVFPNVWVASAFKGATGVCMSMTNIAFHLENHISWLRLIDQKKEKFKNIRGFAITGWQRYDHYAVLCELLPVALPSLAMCLEVLNKGVFSEDLHRKVSTELGFIPGLALDPIRCNITTTCKFPGSDVYMAMFEWIHLQTKCEQYLQCDTFNGWFNEFNVVRGFVSPMHVEPLVSEATSILLKLTEIQSRLQKSLESIFTEDVGSEWVQVYLEPMIKRFSEVVQKGNNLLGSKRK